MKITVKPEKEHPEKEIDFNEIEPGTVFEYDGGGVIALKLLYGEAVLLKYSDGGDWYELADAFKTAQIKKIIGQIYEIRVAEE